MIGLYIFAPALLNAELRSFILDFKRVKRSFTRCIDFSTAAISLRLSLSFTAIIQTNFKAEEVSSITLRNDIVTIEIAVVVEFSEASGGMEAIFLPSAIQLESFKLIRQGYHDDCLCWSVAD